MLLLGGVLVVSLGDVVLFFLWCFLFFLCFVLVSVVVVVLELVDVDVCDCGCSETELLELELLGFCEVELLGFEVAVPVLGVWFCGGVVLWL